MYLYRRLYKKEENCISINLCNLHLHIVYRQYNCTDINLLYTYLKLVQVADTRTLLRADTSGLLIMPLDRVAKN